MLYLDSSAIVKLVAREAGTTELVQTVRADPEVVSSALARPRGARTLRITSLGVETVDDLG